MDLERIFAKHIFDYSNPKCKSAKKKTNPIGDEKNT